MKTLRFPLLVVLAAGSLLAACSKDKNQENVTPKTPTELLAGKNWMMTACTVSPAMRTADGRTITDYYAERNTFDRDDLWQFDKPDALKHDEGATKARSTDPQSYPGTWSLTQSDKVLRTTVPGLYDNTYDVQEISENTMRLSGVRTEGSTQYTFTFTYTRQ